VQEQLPMQKRIRQTSLSRRVGKLFTRIKELSREKGISYVVRSSVEVMFNWPIDAFVCWYYQKFKSSRTFVFQKITYKYFYHRYNPTWRNERAVEIPIIWRVVEKYQGQKILEVGNVLSHYFPFHHDILDKYEKADGVLNQDVINFHPAGKYDLIVSISTLEHVGWDENPRDPLKILKAFENLKSVIAPGGKLVVSLPVGYNTALDELLISGKIRFTDMYCLKRVSDDNDWAEVGWNDVCDSKFDPVIQKINGLIIGIMENK
jgi:SAM-dependent methyltransferase